MMIMDVVCWNCKKTTSLEEGQVATAIKQMDDSKLGFFDVACPHCQKSNRVEREKFVAAYTHRHDAAEQARKAKKEKDND